MSRGIEAFKAERERQIAEEGYDAAHDSTHGADILLRAGVCYADFVANDLENMGQDEPHPFWPAGWEWKPGDSQLRALEKAGALIAAAYDQLWNEVMGENA